MGSYLLKRRSKLRYKQQLMLSLLPYKTWGNTGDPLSPYLFVTAVEILAIAIRNQGNIKGITTAGLETKLLQFADDTAAVLSDLDPARDFGLLERSEKASDFELMAWQCEETRFQKNVPLIVSRVEELVET